MKKLIVITSVFLLGTVFGTYYMPFAVMNLNCDTSQYSGMWVPLRDLREQPFKCRELPIEARIETNPKMLLSILKADLAYYYYKITGKRID